MGRYFALSMNLPAQHQRYSRESRVKTTKNNILLNNRTGVFVFVALCLMLLTYIVQINSFSTKGYEIKSLEKKISSLKEEQKALQIQSAELQSFQRIQGDTSIINMVPVSTIMYIQTTALSER
ncbi:MAG: hypothetical protein ACYC5G_03030 [Candidatus Doudnabacteria bacterium]